MGFWRVTKAIVTLGGSEALAAATDEYNKAFNEYKEKCSRAISLKQQCEDVVASTGVATKKAVQSLKVTYKIFKRYAVEGRSEKWQIGNADFQISLGALKLIPTVAAGMADAVALTKGAAVGTGLATGSWALVSVLGTASTGTAIASLNGVAATNAILAWFGGGALAAGGGGMAAGAMTLGALALVPMIAVASVSTYKKASQIENETKNICLKVIPETEQIIRDREQLLNKLCEGRDILLPLYEELETQLTKTKELLYPFGFLSRIACHFRYVQGRKFRGKQIRALRDLDEIAEKIARALTANTSATVETQTDRPFSSKDWAVITLIASVVLFLIGMMIFQTYETPGDSVGETRALDNNTSRSSTGMNEMSNSAAESSPITDHRDTGENDNVIKSRVETVISSVQSEKEQNSIQKLKMEADGSPTNSIPKTAEIELVSNSVAASMKMDSDTTSPGKVDNPTSASKVHSEESKNEKYIDFEQENNKVDTEIDTSTRRFKEIMTSTVSPGEMIDLPEDIFEERKQPKHWWCLCYKTKDSDGFKTNTVCRSTNVECRELERNAIRKFREYGENLLVEACKWIEGEHPDEKLGEQSTWRMTTMPLSYWFPGRCML